MSSHVERVGETAERPRLRISAQDSSMISTGRLFCDAQLLQHVGADDLKNAWPDVGEARERGGDHLKKQIAPAWRQRRRGAHEEASSPSVNLTIIITSLIGAGRVEHTTNKFTGTRRQNIIGGDRQLRLYGRSDQKRLSLDQSQASIDFAFWCHRAVSSMNRSNNGRKSNGGPSRPSDICGVAIYLS